MVVVEVYISHPKRSTSVPSCCSPHRFINAQLIANQLAANGHLGVMPDLFHGDPEPLNNRPASFDLVGWLIGLLGHLPDRVERVAQGIPRETQSNMGYDRVDAVGYCFGVC